jgi:outer membrane protein assembly factor BamE
MRLANRFPRAGAITLALAMFFAAGCAKAPVPMPEFVKPYRMTIQQGNFVTRDMVEQLKPGMTKEQVRFILGTPLLTDIFHADRWDYTFYRDAPGAKREQRNFSVIFEDQKLARVVGDLLPEPGEPARAAPAKPAASSTAPRPVAPPKEEPGFFGRLFGGSGSKPEQPAAETPKPAPAEEKQATGQNWGAAEPPKEPAPAPAPPKAEAEPEQKSERGFFGRMLEKIGF